MIDEKPLNARKWQFSNLKNRAERENNIIERRSEFLGHFVRSLLFESRHGLKSWVSSEVVLFFEYSQGR